MHATSRRRLAIFAALAVCSAFVVGLIALRVERTGANTHGWLVWNLFLAWIPFVLALVVYDAHRRGARPLRLLPLSVLWLLFLPNAPYIVTDFVHLQEADGIPLWYDILVITGAAWTGLMLGLLSLFLMHGLARDRVGAAWAWCGVVAVLGLCSIGIYLGRVLRWNSWDALVQPRALLADMRGRLEDGTTATKTVGMVVVLTGFLTLTYFVVYAVARLDPADE